MFGVLSVSVLVVAVAAGAAAVLMGENALPVIFAAAAAVSLLGAAVSLELVRRGALVSQEKAAMGMLAGIAARLVVAACGVLLRVSVLGMPREPALAAMLVGYLVVLVVEVWLLARYFRALPSAAEMQLTVKEAGSC